MINKEQILESERMLLEAFQNKDLTILEELLHDNLQFILPNGLLETKQGVLDNYRKGDTVMTSIIPNDYIINFIGDTAIVSLNLEQKGKYFDQVIEAKFRYMLVWKLFDHNWKVIAGGGNKL